MTKTMCCYENTLFKSFHVLSDASKVTWLLRRGILIVLSETLGIILTCKPEKCTIINESHMSYSFCVKRKTLKSCTGKK